MRNLPFLCVLFLVGVIGLVGGHFLYDHFSRYHPTAKQAQMPERFLNRKVHELKDGQTAWVERLCLKVDKTNAIWIDLDGNINDHDRRYCLFVIRHADYFTVFIDESDYLEHPDWYRWDRRDSLFPKNFYNLVPVAKFAMFKDRT